MSKTKKPLVGIVMGSDSDLPIMQEAADICKEMGIACEMSILSAHRTPKAAATYAETVLKRGVKVIIAGAGGAAHLAGVLAAFTTTPVIGIPIPTKNLDGMDSLLSTVQMPPGVPVATVAIGGGKNAGLLACQILAVSYPELHKKLIAFKVKMAKVVLQKNRALKRK